MRKTLAGSVAWGVLSEDVFGGRRVIVLQIAATVAAICSMLLAFIPGDITWVWVVLVVVLFDFTVTGFNGVWMNAASETVSREFAGLATSLTVSVGSLGIMVVLFYCSAARPSSTIFRPEQKAHDHDH